MRLAGAVLVFLGCGYFGFAMVTTHKKEERMLRQIISAIDYMECEMQYRLTPLPRLMGQTAKEIGGIVGSVFAALSAELENQISPEVSLCMDTVLRKQRDIPQYAQEAFWKLGMGLGRFDLQGQLKELEAVRALCQRHLKMLENNRDTRLRSYQTLGLCAGAALAILLL